MRFDADNPKWVKVEFAELKNPELEAVARKILNAPPELRGPIWKGFEKRKLSATAWSSKLEFLAHSVRKGLRQRRGSDLLSPQEKLVLAKRLDWAAKEFATACRLVKKSMGGNLPFEVNLSSAAAELLASTEPYATQWKERKQGEDIFPAERALLLNALNRPEVVADVIADGAAAWGRKKLLLNKPNHRNADRLWFIRIVTESFVFHCGEPMREEVACLANIWFGDSKLTANALSEIAKVSELPSRTPRLSQKRPPSE